MNEELKNQLTQFLEKALDVVEKGIDTAGEQIPLILQEIIYWQISSNSILFVFGVILLFVAYKTARSINMEKDFDDPFIILPKIVLLVASGIICLPLLACSLDAVKALVAPRLVIIEYLKGLL